MMELIYREETPLLSEIEERLKDLALAYQETENKEAVNDLVLQEEDQYIGEQAILKRIEELEEELKKWWYCSF